MTAMDIVPIIISGVALIVSVVTAYRTHFARFRGQLFVEPRVMFSHFDTQPTIIIGCEVINRTTASGTIEDLVLVVKHRHKSTNNVNRYSFVPLLMRNDYDILREYSRQDFSHFKSITVPQNSQLTRYIVFEPTDDTFSPKSGDFEMQLYCRNLSEDDWTQTMPATFVVSLDDDLANRWSNKQGIMTEKIAASRLRNKLMDRL